MQEIKIEDTVLLINVSRSMLRRDFNPNRLTIAIQAAKNFIQSKIAIDPKDRISIISFGGSIKKLIPYSNEEISLIESLKKIQISGKGKIHEAIAFSLQIIIQEMRKIGGKVQRIVIISDSKLKIEITKINKLINISKGLGVFVDACQIGKIQEGKQNMLKKITQLTGGEYGYFNNTKAIINAGKSFASKKMVKETIAYSYSNKEEKKAPLIGEIALSLRRPSVMEIRMMMRNGAKGQDKCQICHSIKAPTGADFYSEGRYCPNCDHAIHLSCAALWAKSSEHKENIFRCPFCFFLLKLPKSAVKLIEHKEEDNQKIKIIEDNINQTKMIEISEEYINQINASCSYCHNIFLGDFKVYECQKCGSYYHEPCVEKMYNEIKSCRFCGAQIVYN